MNAKIAKRLRKQAKQIADSLKIPDNGYVSVSKEKIITVPNRVDEKGEAREKRITINKETFKTHPGTMKGKYKELKKQQGAK